MHVINNTVRIWPGLKKYMSERLHVKANKIYANTNKYNSIPNIVKYRTEVYDLYANNVFNKESDEGCL